MIIPHNFKLQYSTAEIQEVNAKMGRKISEWINLSAEKDNQSVIVVPILRGAIFFFADLVRYIDQSVSIAPIRCWAYHAENNQSRDDVEIDLQGLEVEGRRILLVDDICDSGQTLKKVSDQLRHAGALEVKSAVLIRRKLDKILFDPNYVGFDYTGHEWFVGYGMNFQDGYRNLSDIYTVNV